MSQENVEIARRVIDAFNRRDLDAYLADHDPEVVVDWSQSPGVQAGIYQGHQAVREFWSNFFEMFDRITMSPEEFIESGDHVVVPNRTCFWGRDGMKVEVQSPVVVTLRKGRIAELRMYRERAEALKAVGLEE